MFSVASDRLSVCMSVML